VAISVNFLVQLVDPPIGLLDAVLSDVIPNVEDVGRSQRPTRDAPHRRLCRLASAPRPAFALGLLGTPRFARPALQALANVIAQLIEFGGAQPVLLLR
jgi:hypothetical protein